MMEHESEPTNGLPGPLPKGEALLWQGRPDWWSLALRAFHVRAVAIYFALLMAWRGLIAVQEGATLAEAVVAVAGLATLGLAAIAILTGLAWLSARATVYTITTKRVVIRSGVAIQLALNVPYKLVGSAALRNFRDGSGDIPLTVLGKDRVSYIILWPHVRPWRLGRPEPTLRCVPDAARVADLLSGALAQSLTQEGPQTIEHAAPAERHRPQLVDMMGSARA